MSLYLQVLADWKAKCNGDLQGRKHFQIRKMRSRFHSKDSKRVFMVFFPLRERKGNPTTHNQTKYIIRRKKRKKKGEKHA